MSESKVNATQVGGDHYRKMKIQPWDFIIGNGIPWAEGTVIQYVSRWRSKGGVDDLRKARHVLDKLIEQAASEHKAEPQSTILMTGQQWVTGTGKVHTIKDITGDRVFWSTHGTEGICDRDESCEEVLSWIQNGWWTRKKGVSA